jgi:cobalt-zinc-cadmium resistance protein CzcA
LRAQQLMMAAALAVLLPIRGAIAFHSLLVGAYPDMANNYVQVITQPAARARREHPGHDD